MIPRTHRDARPRAAALLTATLLAAGLLAGCSDSTEPGASASTETTQDQQDETSSDAQDESPAPVDDDATSTGDASEGLGYPGEDGRTALELLLEADPTAEVVGEGEEAYVVGIGGHSADEAKNEFWALYLNGEMAQVGAGVLDTTTGDEIEWKLETY